MFSGNDLLFLVLELTTGKDFVILACVVLTQYQHVTARQTDRYADYGYYSTLYNLQLCYFDAL